jgi:hypothetical protein
MIFGASAVQEFDKFLTLLRSRCDVGSLAVFKSQKEMRVCRDNRFGHNHHTGCLVARFGKSQNHPNKFQVIASSGNHRSVCPRSVDQQGSAIEITSRPTRQGET